MNIATSRPWDSLEEAPAVSALEERTSVLFVQDDPDVAEMYRMKLEFDGYDVTVIEPDELRGRSVADFHAEIVFVDIRAPHKERARILSKLRGRAGTKRVPVVILSDYNRKELNDAGVRVKSVDYLVVNLTKPSSHRLGMHA